MDSNTAGKRPLDYSSGEAASFPRAKRPKSSKACNACRKQKSRCERLAGDAEGCHRCGVIGIRCVFDLESGSSMEGAKARRPRPILPRARKPDERRIHRAESPDNSGLHVLANTTEMLSRASYAHDIGHSPSSRAPLRPSQTLTPSTATLTPAPTPSATPSTTTLTTSLSPETLSTVESTLFPLPRDSTTESESARFRADWRRWVAPLTLLQTLVRRNRVGAAEASVESYGNTHQGPARMDAGILSPAEEVRLKNHFRLRYLPWLPAVRVGKNGVLDDVSPFLDTVIYATASRTCGDSSPGCLERLRSLALHHVGQVFANPAAYPLVDSLYALLILVLWPLDAADDVALLIHGAKRLASAREQGSLVSPTGDLNEPEDVDHTRLWYTICANDTILTLGAGSATTSPAVDDLILTLGTASELALSGGCTADILLILQASLHKIISTAMGERGFSPEKTVPSLPKGRESLLNYISTVHMFLTRLGEWEIEFCTISGECASSEAPRYAALEIEYHYLCLMFATHCLLTLCHACPLASASDEVKYALWSWSITGNKSAHALIRLFNNYSRAETHAQGGEGEERRPAPLAMAPDRVFAMVVVAVMLILRHQVASYEYGRRRGCTNAPSAGFTQQAEQAIRRSIERMAYIGRRGSGRGRRGGDDGRQQSSSSATTTYDHAAGRYVDILEALVRIWEEKRAQRVAFVAASGFSSGDYGFQVSKGGEGVGEQQQQQQQQQHQHQHQQQQQQEAHVGVEEEAVVSVPPHGHGGADMSTMQLDLDFNLLGGDLFSDAAAAFTWDGLGSLDWGASGQ